MLGSRLGSGSGLVLRSGVGLGLGSDLANYTYQQTFPNDSLFNVYHCSYLCYGIITHPKAVACPEKTGGWCTK